MPRSRSSGQTTRRTTTAPSRGFGTATAPTHTATRSSTSAHPPAVSHPSAPASHAPSHAPTAPMQAPAQAGGGMLSGLAGTVMQGMAFGTGSAVAHRAVDGVMGARQVEHVHKDENGMQANESSGQNRQQPFSCQDETTQFQQCLTQNNGNLSACQFFFDSLTQCKQNLRM